jgi:hypothetical protein
MTPRWPIGVRQRGRILADSPTVPSPIGHLGVTYDSKPRTEVPVHIAAQMRVNIVNELRVKAKAYTINDKICSV